MDGSVPGPVVVLACGQVTRGDDAAGLLAARALSRSVGTAAVQWVGQLQVTDLLDVPDGRPCLVIDAVRGIAPGSIFVRPLANLANAGAMTSGQSSHTLPVAEAVALATALGHPVDGWFVGIGGEDFETPLRLSPVVRDAMPRFVATCRALVAALVRRESVQRRVDRCA
jgi:hydrogenase maturation protease